MKAASCFERAVERATGERIDVVRCMPIDERRRMIQARTGKQTRFVSRFPLIGRGNILRNRFKTTDEINAALDRALRK